MNCKIREFGVWCLCQLEICFPEGFKLNKFEQRIMLKNSLIKVQFYFLIDLIVLSDFLSTYYCVFISLPSSNAFRRWIRPRPVEGSLWVFYGLTDCSSILWIYLQYIQWYRAFPHNCWDLNYKKIKKMYNQIKKQYK